MKRSDYFLFGGFLLIVIGVLIFTNWKTVKDLFTPHRVCVADADCNRGEFCGDGICKPYWNGLSMPWYNCRDPSYCVGMQVRQPCGLVSNMEMSRCGTQCLTDSECPKGCPKCARGVCSAAAF